MATPDELRQYRAAALQELTLRLGQLSSAELDMTRSTQVAAAILDYQGRLRSIEEAESTAEYELAAETERRAAHRQQVYGGQATPPRTAGGQFVGDEGRIQQAVEEMQARGLGRV